MWLKTWNRCRRGATATLLVAAGTLRLGDVVAAGASFGKVGPETPLYSGSWAEAVLLPACQAEPRLGAQLWRADRNARK